jgi:hypothetical protein
MVMDHEKHDCREARDSEKDTDLSPCHLATVREIGGRLRGANSRKKRRIAVNIAKLASS